MDSLVHRGKACVQSHSLGSGMQDGSISIAGFPSTIIANTTYTLTLTDANPNGLGVFGGFQMVILNSNNQNAGTLSNPGPHSTIQSQNGRMYHEHNPAQTFDINHMVSWTVDRTAPVGSGPVTYCAAAILPMGMGAVVAILLSRHPDPEIWKHH